MAERDPIPFVEDNPEWTKADFERARPAGEVLPPAIAKGLVRKRGRPAGSRKEPVSLRLDKDVLEKFRATGPGWQSRINEVLKRSATMRKPVKQKPVEKPDPAT